MYNKIYSLEFLRFIAASLVLFFHIPIIEVGKFGVDIFFIISGFVMMHSTQIESRNFLLKRIIRIVPLYWMLTIAIFLSYYIVPSIFTLPERDIIHLINSLLFVPFDKNGYGHSPILSVGWTLNYEFYFYVLFSLACIISNKNRGIISVLLLLILMFVFSFFDNFITSIYSDLIVIEFALGILLFYFFKKDMLKFSCVIFLIILSFLFKFDFEHRFFLLGLPSLFIVALFIKYNSKVFKTNFISLLGAISYSLYLSHYYIVNLFLIIMKGASADSLFIQIISVICIYTVSVFIAIILYKIFENKTLQFLRSRFL